MIILLNLKVTNHEHKLEDFQFINLRTKPDPVKD